MKIIGTTTRLAIIVLAVTGLGAAGCQGEKKELAPAATNLTAPVAKAQGAAKFAVDKASSKVEFMMDAPQEKIRGRVSGAAEGDLQVDLADVTRTTGLITVNIAGIELFQTKAGENGKFGEETKSDLQNEHARQWLEIWKDAPEAERAKNEKAQFAIKSISTSGEKDIGKIAGAERKVTLTATGDFLLHQRKSERVVELEATFKYAGDKPVSVAIKTVKPFTVGLTEHDVKPRTAFGVLAQKTLGELAPKVAKEAMVSLELTAALSAGDTAPAKAAEPAK